ncbi:MAG: DUF554 domain-containing protein [Anaerolineales bacterium]|nr:DUF554 domain-containing protein [Anaerolineales bacterium]
MTGTILNVITVVVGGALGAMLGARLPEKMRDTVMHGLGLMTLVIGVQMAIGTRNILIVLASILFGGILGEMLGIQARLDALGKILEARFARGAQAGTFTRGFVTASLVFCVGPMTILGSIQDGLIGDYNLLAIKSTLDGFAALAFASTLGIGVAFSALTVFVVQGAISLAAMLFGGALGAITRTTPWVIEMTATGGVLIMGIGLILLDLKQVRVGNLLPAIFIAPLIVVVLAALDIKF